jgi:hypothetical protein
MYGIPLRQGNATTQWKKSGSIGKNQKKSVKSESIGKNRNKSEKIRFDGFPIRKKREKSEKSGKSEKIGINQKKSGLLGFGTRSNLIPPQRRGIGKIGKNRKKSVSEPGKSEKIRKNQNKSE